MDVKQFFASFIISLLFLGSIITLIKKGRLEIKYCWLWLGIGFSMLLVVLKYEWVVWVSHLIGAVTVTTTLFLFATLILFLICFQLTIIVSSQRRSIKKLVQQIALKDVKIYNSGCDHQA